MAAVAGALPTTGGSAQLTIKSFSKANYNEGGGGVGGWAGRKSETSTSNSGMLAAANKTKRRQGLLNLAFGLAQIRILRQALVILWISARPKKNQVSAQANTSDFHGFGCVQR